VRVAHGASQRFRQRRRLLGRQRTRRQLLVQTAAVHVFQSEIRFAIVFADVVNLHDMAMVQTRHRLGLTAKTSEGFLRSRAGGAKQFDGDQAIESLLPRFPYYAHAALTQHFQQFVAGQAALSPRRGGKRGPLGTDARIANAAQQQHQ
jgi:hypothetical protein